MRPRRQGNRSGMRPKQVAKPEVVIEPEEVFEEAETKVVEVVKPKAKKKIKKKSE